MWLMLVCFPPILCYSYRNDRIIQLSFRIKTRQIFPPNHSRYSIYPFESMRSINNVMSLTLYLFLKIINRYGKEMNYAKSSLFVMNFNYERGWLHSVAIFSIAIITYYTCLYYVWTHFYSFICLHNRSKINS